MSAAVAGRIRGASLAGETRWDVLAAEIDRLNRTDPREALTWAASWLATEWEAGSLEGHARALRAHGHALRFLGEYQDALAAYEQAEAQFLTLGLRAEAARTQIGHVTALRYLGRYQQAVDLARQTRAYFLRQGDQLQAAKQAMNLGTVFRPMGRLADALAAYRQARTVFRRLGERSLLADVEQNIGNVLVDLGRFEEALRRLQAAERIRRALGLRAEVALTLLNIGILCYRRSDYGRALQALSQAGSIYQSLGVERGARLVDLQMLPTAVALNLRAESTAAAERAIEGLRALAMPFELGQALIAAAGLAESEGALPLARARIDEACEIFSRIGNRVWEAGARLQRARLVAIGGGLEDGAAAPELWQALGECQTATQRLEAAEALDRAAFGRLVEGVLLVRLGAAPEALDCFGRVLAAAGALHADHLLFQAHAAIGELLETTDVAAAIASYRRAIDHLEHVRARALADDLQLSFLADKADLYERVVGLLIERETAEALAEAYDFVERSKSRTLLEELLAGDETAWVPRRSRVASLVRRVRDIRTRLNDAYTVVYGADQVPSWSSVARSGEAATVTDLEQEFLRATRELQLAARAESAIPLVGAGAESSDLSLPNGVALIEFYSVGDDLVAFVNTGGELRLRRLMSVGEVARLVEKLGFHIGKSALGSDYLRANIDPLRTGIERCLHALWQGVVAPLEDDLVGKDRLVVIPHGPLHGLPFHAFHDGERYLGERFTVTYAPSAGVYRACARGARTLGERAVVVGIEDPGLPWVGHEVDAVARAWPSVRVLAGKRATSRALRRQAGTFDALHVASHAVFRADNPGFSSIKLADAWLTVTDLTELARGAQLVTLSACETAVGGLAVGDEVVGLTRGLLAAGCSTVVASLWTVNDESTAKLMAGFYASLRQGDEPAEALRAAMLELRRAYDHPYFWAPFVVVGGGTHRAGAD